MREYLLHLMLLYEVNLVIQLETYHCSWSEKCMGRRAHGVVSTGRHALGRRAKLQRGVWASVLNGTTLGGIPGQGLQRTVQYTLGGKSIGRRAFGVFNLSSFGLQSVLNRT